MIPIVLICSTTAALILFVGVPPPVTAKVVNHYYEFQVEAKQHCIDSLRDHWGDPVPCRHSIATETAGLTLPGMEDGILTTRSHVIIASDGSEANIEAHPSYPYQYFINTMTERSTIVERVMNGESHLVGKSNAWADITPATLSSPRSLEDDGWAFLRQTERDGMLVNEWVKQSAQGVDNATGFNTSMLYAPNLAPDTHTLYMDENNEYPINIISTNSIHNHVIHHEVSISNFKKKEGHLSVGEAHDHIRELYGIKKTHTMTLAAVNDKNYNDDEKSWRTEVLSGNIPPDSRLPPGAAEWMPHRHLRSSDIIPYFTIEDGSAAATYFGKVNRPRALLDLFNMQYPFSCKNSTIVHKYCLYVKSVLNDYRDSFRLNAGVRIPDVSRPEREAIFDLSLGVALSMDNKYLVLDLAVSASGCATLWGAGEPESFTIGIVVCFTASGGGHYENKTASFSASISMSLSLGLFLADVGSLVEATLYGSLGASAAPNNVVSAYGQIGVTHSIFIAGVTLVIDVTAANANNFPIDGCFLQDSPLQRGSIYFSGGPSGPNEYHSGHTAL